MTDCFQPWNDNFVKCTNATGGLEIPGLPNAENLALRVEICATPECQKLMTVFRALIASQCEGALNETKKFPNGMYTATYCPTTNTSDPAFNPPSVPAPSPAAKGGGISKRTMIAAIGGIVVVVGLVILVFVVLWRQRSKATKPPTPERDLYRTLLADSTEDDTCPELEAFVEEHERFRLQRIEFKNLEWGSIISDGGYGLVVKGTYLNQDVAVKFLRPTRRRIKHCILEFVKEIKLTSELEHECLVKYIGFAWDIPGNLCMITEYMHGGDLRSVLDTYATTGHPHGHDDHKLRIAFKVVFALTYLHTLENPVIHRDLKSRNILLSEEGNAKLIDFGISREREDKTLTAGVGSFLWMAPEIMRGQRYDEKADVFSFGVVLSELDTHELPYNNVVDPTTNEKMTDTVLNQKISKGEIQPQFTECAHPGMKALALDCLQLDPTARPSASDILYRIHSTLHKDPTVTEETRDAIRSSLHTLEIRGSVPYDSQV